MGGVRLRVTAALAWWNESPEDLADCVRGAANIADKIVAIDGSYARYPEATIRSTDLEVETIRHTADEVGIECLVLQPDRLWAGQIEKRAYLLSIASVGSDWVAVVDTDHIVHSDREAARSALEQVPEWADVIDATFWTPLHPERSLQDSSAGVWHMDQAGVRVTHPHIYRALPGLKVHHRHWCVSAIKGGNPVWLWPCGDGWPHAKHVLLPVPYEIEHRTLLRTEEWIRLSRGFLNDRQKVIDLTDQEDDVPGLPSPVFDFSINKSR